MLRNWLRTSIPMAGIEVLFGMAARKLKDILNYFHHIPMQVTQVHAGKAQMKMIDPLSVAGIKGLFSLGPQTEERVSRLMKMAQRVA